MSAKSVITIPSEGGAGRPTAFPLKKGKKDASGVKPPTRGPTKEAGRCSTTGGSPGVVLSLCSEVSSPQLAFPARNLQSGKISCRPDGLTAPLLSASLALDRPFGGREGGNLATFSFVRTRFPAYPRTGANLLSMRGQELAPALCTKYLRGRTRKPYGYYATMREPYGYYATTPCCC